MQTCDCCGRETTSKTGFCQDCEPRWDEKKAARMMGQEQEDSNSNDYLDWHYRNEEQGWPY